MKVTVENLGILKKAEFEVGDLTIICGANNTGKTYATYALYGFINFWNEAFEPDLLKKNALETLLQTGTLIIDLDEIYQKRNAIINHACKEYLNHLPMVFAAPKKSFSNTVFSVSLAETDARYIDLDKTMQSTGPNRRPYYNLHKNSGEHFITINIIAKAEDIGDGNKDWLTRQINHSVLGILFGNIFPPSFIASIERTGAATFRKELDLIRNRLLEQVSNRDNDINPLALIRTYYDKGYALPVKENVDFIRSLEDVVKYESYLAKNNPDIIESFDQILGGGYRVTREGLYYIPFKSSVKLTMGESASSVRSLLNIGTYIRHLADPGDLLMIDEPELNLHPMNQRSIARVIAKLVNAGIRVFITTHSDYILKELNTLIMLKRFSPDSFSVMEKYHYQENELLDVEVIKAYIAKKELIKLEGFSKRQWHNIFVSAPIGNYGREVSDFDDTINLMNEIQDELLFGGHIK